MQGRSAVAARDFAPDVIHDNGLWLAHNHQVADLARQSGAPRVVSTRGMLAPWAIRHKGWKKKLAWRLYQRRDLDRASALHATAEAEAKNLSALGLAGPIFTIPNGVELPDLDPPKPSSDCGVRTAAFLGRLYPVKGLPMLVEAWARVRPPGWRLVIAGPDEAGHRRVLENAVGAAGLGEAIMLIGPVTGSAKRVLLQEADLFVLPSYTESFGMAVGEALAHATPVLTTTAVPWPDLEARGCGWRAAPTVEAIAEALRVATRCDRATLRAMGAAGRAYVAESFGWDSVGAQFEALYDRLLTSRPSASAMAQAAA